MLGVPTLLLCLVETFAVAAPKTAVFPLAGEAISVADLPTVDAIDGEVRRAVEKRLGAALQRKQETLVQVEVLRDVGLVCAVDDLACQTRIAIMADVDEAILGVVSLRPGQNTLTLTLLDKASGRAVARVRGAIAEQPPARTRDIDALVERLLVVRPSPILTEGALPRAAEASGGVPPARGAPSDASTPRADEARDPARTTSTTAPAEGQDPSAAASPSLSWWLLVGGGGVAVVSLVALVAASAGVVGVELLLAGPMSWSQRVPLALAGQGLLVVGALSLVTLAAGGGLAASSLLVE